MMSDSENQIGFEQLGLGSVLQRYVLAVPANQREYAWTDKEVTTLLQDFARAIGDGETAYFLGTIVTIPRPNGILEVVDGQQRLATTAILLAAIRDYLQKSEPIISDQITNVILNTIDRTKRERVPRLSLNLDDNDFFKSIISGGSEEPTPQRSSHERLFEAYKAAKAQVRKIVSGYDDKDHGNVLNRWLDFIEHNALVVLLRVPNDANAYKMFETLNDRGLKTSQSDLVKNYLFGRSAERLPEVQQKWAFMRGALESLENEDITVDYLRHAITTVYGFVREAQVYEKVQDIAKAPQSAVTFITNLETLSNTYVAIHNPEHERWNKYSDAVRRAIVVLNLFNIRPMRPIMLAVASKFSEKEAETAFKLLIVLSVRLLIAGTTRSGSVEQPLAINAFKIYNGEITTTAELKRVLKDITPTDDQFKKAFEIATVSNAKLARYYLRSLELAAKTEGEPWLIPNDDKQIINLEHILPRNTGNHWPEISEEIASANTNRIGNLALLQASSNSDLKSFNFTFKRAVYAKSPYVLTKQIADVESWNEETISARQQTLAALALKAWPT